jgi:hypothetical protein
VYYFEGEERVAGCVTLTETLITRVHNRGRYFAVATEFCTLASNICGSSLWKFLYVALLVSRLVTSRLNFRKIYALIVASIKMLNKGTGKRIRSRPKRRW